MKGWKFFKLGEVAKFLNGRAYKEREFKIAGTPIVRIQNLTGKGNTVYSDLVLPENKYINSGDLIYAWSATFGPYIWKGIKSIYHYHIWKILCNEILVIKHFLYYHLLNVSDNLKDEGSGTLFIHITKGLMESFEINLPSPPEQKAIASVLSSLDDKIDLLYRQNQTLEAMAETLFRQWFVDRVYSCKVSDLIKCQNGCAFKSRDFKGVGVNGVIKIKNISGSIVDIYNSDFIEELVATQTDSKFIIETGDVLFAMTGAEIGKMGIVPQTEQKLWLNQRVGLFKEKYNGSRFLAYLQLKSDYGQDYIDNTATGSAQPNISSTGIVNCDFPYISEEQIIIYSKQLSSLFGKIIFNLGQIRTLEKLRDTLLPKLMSGEVRVEYAH